MKQLLITFVLLIKLSWTAISCTAIQLNSLTKHFAAKNYDWNVGSGFLTLNERNKTKTALLFRDPKPAQWTSKYGSITFNQFGMEFPNGGMNELGLVIEVLWLEETKYPKPDKRQALNELQWIQYLLDNCSDVDEAVSLQSKIRISETHANVHYFLTDITGNTAIIEFIDGTPRIHCGNDMPVAGITNDNYAFSLEMATKSDWHGDSMDRFRQLHQYTISSPTISSEKDAFELLNTCKRGRTQWQIVYNLEDKTIYFQTGKSQSRKYLDLNTQNFENNEKLLYCDLNTNLHYSKKKLEWAELTPKINKKYIIDAFNQIDFLADIPEEMISRFANYPFNLASTNSNKPNT